MKSLEFTSPSSARSPRPASPERVLGVACLTVFLVITVLMQAGALRGLDVAVMYAKNSMTSDLLKIWSEFVAVLLSAELSIVYTATVVFLLLRIGLGYLSVAPGAWLIGTALEGAMKLVFHQPRIPDVFRFPGNYPLTSVNLPGSFPSGHAMRTAFVFVFLGVLLWSRGGRRSRIAAVCLVVPALAAAYSRIYMGYHWPSDVVAGLLLGTAIALLVAPPLMRRLFRHP